MPVTVAQNPFIGPRPISKDEPIFGRDEEINRLTHLLLAERIVLLYSPSGAGKSSLIHAGLLRSLTEETEDDFYLPPTIGLSITASSAAPGPSLFSEAVIRSLERAGPANGSTGKIDSIEEYLRSHLKKSANGRCICLVFDQFEECVTFLPGQEAAKSAFFLDLARTLADPNVWALFAVREDFLAPIIDLGRVLPTRFKQAFRLDFLSKSRAQEVIQKTAHLGHYEFAAAALEQLVNDLAIVNVQGVDGTFSSIPGEYVEPLHLQVACRHIIQRLSEGTTKIEKWHLECPTNGGPRPESSVDDALAAYYENELSKITENNKARERDLRFWIEENLFDASGIRIPIRQSVRLTQGLDNETIEKLYDSYLVRKERRLNATWYELAHDRLVQPIRLNNKEWFDQNLGLLGKSFREWTRRSRDSRYLLNARDLKRALKENQANFGSLAADEKTFVNESKKRIRARRLVVMIPFALAALCAAAAFYFKQQREFLAYYNNRLAYYSSFAVLRPLYSGWTPGSLDRNVLFACHLVKEVSHWKTPADPLFYGDVVTILDRALARRGRLQATYWNYGRPASSTEVGDRIPVGAVAYSPHPSSTVSDILF